MDSSYEELRPGDARMQASGGDSVGSSMGSCLRKRASVAQYNADAQLLEAFDKSQEQGTPFRYSTEVPSAPRRKTNDGEIPIYLNKIQRSGLVQSFGCLLCVDQKNFSVIAYSENAHQWFGAVSLGMYAGALFVPDSAASLSRAILCKDLSMLNPIWVQSATRMKHFYAILHRVDVGIVIDLEPAMAQGGDPGCIVTGAVRSQKLASRAISKLQALPGGDVDALCDMLVESVKDLTGYDRVMVYKFHEDEHGEVVAESRRPDLESYLGLHYPATDIPQVARFLFKQNRVRMICNCSAKPVSIVQNDDLLKDPLCLVNSTLRSPHACHAKYMANMGSIASLTIAIIVNENDSTKMWGLVACHHTATRYVPFPVRYACEFLVKAFSMQLSMELQLVAKEAERRVLQIQTSLYDMLVNNDLTSTITGSPNIMDLVKCDGAAIYHDQDFYLLGIGPSEFQMRELVKWLLENLQDSTGITTESLVDAGFPGAESLGTRVCGMACARINTKNFIFWFRSHSEKEIRWGGARHNPETRDDHDMEPRASFNAFLEVMKCRSLPWELVEINAIHSLQLIARNRLGCETDTDGDSEAELRGRHELSSIACEMVRLIENANVPIIAVDCSGHVNGWNAKAAELTGLPAREANGKSLVHELTHEDSRQAVVTHLSRALQGIEDKGIELKLRVFGAQQSQSAVFFVANACSSKDYMQNIIGVCFVGQDVTELKMTADKFVCLQGDYKSIVHGLNPLIPPVFTIDESMCCSDWNTKMEIVTGWKREEMKGKLVPGEVFGYHCPLKSDDALNKLKIILFEASSGREVENVYFGFYNRDERFVDTLLTVNQRRDMNGSSIGCICFLQITEPDLCQFFEIQRQKERKSVGVIKELAYIKHEMQSPIRGISFARRLMEESGVTDDQRKILRMSSACEMQAMEITNNVGFECDGSGYFRSSIELKNSDFVLENAISAVLGQAMPLIRETNLHFVEQISEDIKTVKLHADQARIQQVLADFLVIVVHHAANSDCWVRFDASRLDCGSSVAHLQFCIGHFGRGFKSDIIQDLFGGAECTTHEGLVLNTARKILISMNGDVQYIREAETCYFTIDIKLPIACSRASTSS